MKKTMIAGHMKFLLVILSGLLISNTTLAKNKVLIFCKTAGFHHQSIPAGIKAIMQLGMQHKFSVDTTTDASMFTKNNLKKYTAIIFLNTTGDVLNDEQQQAFQQYMQSGGGFVGVHSATDTEYGWQWYGNLVGAYFGSHPKIQEAVLHITDAANIATKHLPNPWKRTDEWYNYKWVGSDLNVLIKLDETSYTGGKMDNNHPISWYHSYDGGRAFYTGLGHTDESYSDPLYLEHLWGGIQYAMGKVKNGSHPASHSTK